MSKACFLIAINHTDKADPLIFLLLVSDLIRVVPCLHSQWLRR